MGRVGTLFGGAPGIALSWRGHRTGGKRGMALISWSVHSLDDLRVDRSPFVSSPRWLIGRLGLFEHGRHEHEAGARVLELDADPMEPGRFGHDLEDLHLDPG